MVKNELIVGTASALGTNGEGIVRQDGFTLFVPYLLPGERAKIRVLKVKGTTGYGKIEELYTPAEERVRPVCAAFFRCGGCQLQHLRYREQLRFKSKLVEDSLRKIGGVEYSVPPCERSDREYGYRNKLQLPIGRKDGKNVIGFYAERSHRIVEISACPIHPEWTEQLIAALRRFMETCGLDGYDESDRSGELRHIVVRELKGKFIVTLVSAVREIAGIGFFLSLLDGIFQEYSFYLNYNPEPTNAVFGKEFRILKGEGAFECEDCGVIFEAGANTFVQVNENVRAKLYKNAVSLVSEQDETVIDCYAGGGLLTAMFARRCGHAYGIEVVPEASACADALKRKNGLQERMTNLCGKVEDLLGGLMKKHPDATVALDPPRAGVARVVLREIMERKVRKILMISCNPATLARDLGILTGALTENERGELIKTDAPCGDYEISYLQPFDMFPQTKHVETLVALRRKEE
ncbi:MAG: 23S rRNA (uracil(1939)-C(5))-methyltransferase RlmD [Candidatus Gallimonas sp.]